MMRRQSILAVLALLAAPCWSRAADSQAAAPVYKEPGVFDDVQVYMNADPATLDPAYGRQIDVRFGWWSGAVGGSQAKVGEWQSWGSSAFVDVDGMWSDGDRTMNFYANNTDPETSAARVQYYDGGFKADVSYQRFIHELDHDPLNNINTVNSTMQAGGPKANNTDPDTYRIFKTDLGAGQDYAVRVQELKASFKLATSQDFKVRLDVWNQQKDGVRQVNIIGMCYNSSSSPTGLPPDHYGPGGFAALGPLAADRCHLLSMPQSINWNTTEIKPVIEFRLSDGVTVEYSRPMRAFQQADQQVGRFYDTTGVLTYNATTNPGPELAAVVPDNFMEMDELKIGAELNDKTHFYGFFMAGENTSQTYTVNPATGATAGSVDMPRYFNDCDVRVSNKSIENVSLTAYAKVFNNYEAPASLSAVAATTTGAASMSGNPTALTAAQQAILTGNWLSNNTNESTFTTGLNGVWRPGGGGYGLGGLAIVSGYEYNCINRQLADYNTNSITATVLPAPDLTQYNTVTNGFQFGPEMRWSQYFDTYLRYKFQAAQSPLVGVQGYNSVANSLLPTTDNMIEIGGTWMPSEHFMINATFGVEYAENHEAVGITNPNTGVTTAYSNNNISFDEEDYPFSINFFYGVTDCFSISGGYSEMSNFVAQNVFAADQTSAGTPTLGGRWSYGGRADVFNFGAQYRATDKLRYTGQVDYVWGHDLISNSNFTNVTAGTSTADIGGYSEVLNRTTKVSVGFDYLVRPRTIVYVRYELYDFFEAQPSLPATVTAILPNQTGTAQGILGGFSAMF